MHQMLAQLEVALLAVPESTVPISATLASGSAICGEKACENCDLSSNRNPNPVQIDHTSLGVRSSAPGCRTLQDTLVSCWSMSTCAATEVRLANSLRRAS
jgi:hypothetical protein